MSELLLPGVITVESEFQGGLTGACGPNAVAAALRWAQQNDSFPLTIHVNSVLQQIVNSPNGVSTLDELQQTIRKAGYVSGPKPASQSAIDFVMQWSGYLPVICFYENGQALVDENTGQGMDAQDLKGHFNTTFGKNGGGPSPRFNNKTFAAGFLVADGDNRVQNPLVNGVSVHRSLNTDLVYYTIQTMLNAQLTDACFVLPSVSTLLSKISAAQSSVQSLQNTITAVRHALGL